LEFKTKPSPVRTLSDLVLREIIDPILHEWSSSSTVCVHVIKRSLPILYCYMQLDKD